MGESLVAFRHSVGFFLALDCSTRVLGGVEDLERKLLRHALPATLARETHDPAAGKHQPAHRPHLKGVPVRAAAYPARLEPQHRGGLAKPPHVDSERPP